MSSSKMKILITGATGFIGRNMVEHFSQDSRYEVHAVHFTRKAYLLENVVFHQVDLRNPNAVKDLFSHNFEILIQAAATTSGSKDIVNNPALHVTDNAVMNSYILREASAAGVKHVLFFSCTVMYPNSDRPLTENDFKADEVYPRYFGVGWTKVYVEKLCEFYSRLGRSKFTVIRHSNIYGPYDKYDLEKSHVFGATITKVMTAEDQVTVWGSGEETRDFLYVDDLKRFVTAAIDNQEAAFELVNVGMGKNYSVKKLVETIIRLSKKNIEIKYDLTKPTIPTKVILDISKSEKLFKWRPLIDLEDGITKTLEWYNANVK
jgi:GDP-L-fucose synthase